MIDQLPKIPKQSSKAIQTFFRTLSKNSYTLEEMIDRKASIMITTNAIIISIILGSTLCQNLVDRIDARLILLLLGIWVTSIISALYSIKPFLKNKEENKNQLSKLVTIKEINKLSLEKYKAKIFETFSGEKTIYESMIEDIYYVGLNIKKKHFYLAVSAYLFLLGISISVFLFAYNFVLN